MPAPVVIGQDEQTELHIQAIIQSGRRQLDIRIWRRGPTGFAPSRSALTLELSDVDALQQGIDELLQASRGGREVARIVWDKDDQRRLRAETEPFGTRFLARFSFWQRTRDTWRQADDGLVIAAEQVEPLRHVIERLRPRLLEAPMSEGMPAEMGFDAASLRRWPAPGADWLTARADRLNFHPRGVQITAAVEPSGDEHRLVLRQWRRQESLWVPEDVAVGLTVPDVDALLRALPFLADGSSQSEEIACVDGSFMRAGIDRSETALLLLDEQPPGSAEYEPRLRLPAEYLPRFGRMVAQAGMLLMGHLGDGERTALQQRVGAEIGPTIVKDALVPALAPTDAGSTPASDGDNLTEEVPVLPGAGAEGGAEEESEPPARRLTPVGEMRLGRHFVYLYLQQQREAHLSLQWDGYSFLIPIAGVQDLLDQLRDLYYESLRGRRGTGWFAGEGDARILMSVHNQGATVTAVLEQEVEGRSMRLTFPVTEVPQFLNAIGAAMKRVMQHLEQGAP